MSVLWIDHTRILHVTDLTRGLRLIQAHHGARSCLLLSLHLRHLRMHKTSLIT